MSSASVQYTCTETVLQVLKGFSDVILCFHSMPIVIAPAVAYSASICRASRGSILLQAVALAGAIDDMTQMHKTIDHSAHAGVVTLCCRATILVFYIWKTVLTFTIASL